MGIFVRCVIVRVLFRLLHVDVADMLCHKIIAASMLCSTNAANAHRVLAQFVRKQ